MFRVSFCLDEMTLQQLACDQVREPERSELEAHVRSCRRCLAAYESQFTPLVQALRLPPPAESDAERRLIAELVEHLKSLKPKRD
jgi:hypothetical protein